MVSRLPTAAVLTAADGPLPAELTGRPTAIAFT